jgi:hypothetical protein
MESESETVLLVHCHVRLTDDERVELAAAGDGYARVAVAVAEHALADFDRVEVVDAEEV